MMAFGQECPDHPIEPKSDVRLLRDNLILEELKETQAALEHNNHIEFLDGLSDTVVVVSGTLIAYGLAHKAPALPPELFAIVQITECKIDSEIRQLFIDTIRQFIDEYEKSVKTHEFLEGWCNGCIALCVDMAVRCGCDLTDFFKEVHRSNMSKLGADGKPIYRDTDRKVLKGPNYFKPDIAAVWAQQVEKSKI
jgi:hypothetical protein